MSNLLQTYTPLFDIFLLNCGFAFSQYIVLRAGVFSVATAGFGSIGAYCVAILVKNHGAPAAAALALATLLGAMAAALLSIPLARLRGTYQAIATLAFVEIVVSLAFYLEDLTGGAVGLNNIPQLVGTWQLLLAVACVGYVLWATNRSGLGGVFDAVRQDETVASTLGISVARTHALAFVVSGAVGGLFGGLQSLHTYSIEPEMFGFDFMVAVLAAIVLGGRTSVGGPVVGTAILTALPELARPLAANRPLVHGLLLIVIISFLPRGVVDTLVVVARRRRAAWQATRREEATRVVPAP